MYVCMHACVYVCVCVSVCMCVCFYQIGMQYGIGNACRSPYFEACVCNAVLQTYLLKCPPKIRNPPFRWPHVGKEFHSPANYANFIFLTFCMHVSKIAIYPLHATSHFKGRSCICFASLLDTINAFRPTVRRDNMALPYGYHFGTSTG